MRRNSRQIVAVLAISVSTFIAIANFGRGVLPGIPASVRPLGLAVGSETYPTNAGSASWRVVRSASGNPFENYLAATGDGRLYNWGGAFLRYSGDSGSTWSEVRPIEPLLGAEGAVAGAPNGDVVGATWDPYTGDHLLAFKYTASTGTWAYTETVMHTPFFDRPWISVIPGPIELPTGTVPYVTVLIGGWPANEVVYYSFDGLNYLYADTRGVLLSDVPGLSIPATPYADWIQPHTASSITPLPPAGGSAARALQNREGQLLVCPNNKWRAVTTPNLQWGCVTQPGVPIPSRGRMLVDSDGRLHVVALTSSTFPFEEFTYSISSNGGASWNAATWTIPAGMSVEDWDFKAVGGALDFGAIAVHAHKTSGTDQDLVLKFGTATGTAVFQRLFYVGDGDHDFGNGATSTADRFDFASIAILPTGKLAVSFADASHLAAAIAIEQ